jgi:hypothetical protein
MMRTQEYKSSIITSNPSPLASPPLQGKKMNILEFMFNRLIGYMDILFLDMVVIKKNCLSYYPSTKHTIQKKCFGQYKIARFGGLNFLLNHFL